VARFNKVTENKICFIFFKLLSETFLILRRTERDMIKMHIGLHVSTGYCCLTLKKLKYSQEISPQILMKGRQVGSESFQADRHDAGNSRFSQIYKCT
jgi:hypothetical protein